MGVNGCLKPGVFLKQMVSSLESAGLGPEGVRVLWDQYQSARQHESKASFGQEGDQVQGSSCAEGVGYLVES